MQTRYVGPMQADFNNQATTARVEIRVENSEAYPDRLGLSVNNHGSGSEYVLAHLSLAQVSALADALDLWRAERERADD